MAPTGQPPPAAAAAGSVLASEAQLAAERRRVLDGLASGYRMRGLSGKPKAEVAARLARLGRITVAEVKRVAASCSQERGGSKQARRREAVLSPDYEPLLADEINSLFDVFLLARLIVAGRRPGPLAARRRALGSKDLTRVIAKFLARKLISEPEQ